MSRSIIAGAVCALGLAATPAAAEPFRNFVDMCLQTNVDRQAAGARAKAASWYALPADELGEELDDLQDPAIYLSVNPLTAGDKGMPADLEMLMTGWGSGADIFGVEGVRMDACAVLDLAGGDAESLRSRLGDLLGLASIDMDGERVWVFSRQGAGFRSEAPSMDLPEEELLRMARDRKIYVAGVIAEEDMSGLLLAAIRPAE